MYFANNEIKLQIDELQKKFSSNIKSFIKSQNDVLDVRAKSISVVMAAGHGKRIKSSLPKVMHSVWGVPSLQRVMGAVIKGLHSSQQIVVVGKRAESVVGFFGKKKNRCYAYQKEQKGTGHALQTAVKEIPDKFKGCLYVFPGDMGLLDMDVVELFWKTFEKSKLQMMVLTGIYKGQPSENYFGRVLRVPEYDCNQSLTPRENVGKVLKIVQMQDILVMKKSEKISFSYGDMRYDFSRQQLLEVEEFDSGVFAFSYPYLKKLLFRLGNDNAQGEIYLTDFVEVFNENNLAVGSLSLDDSAVLMGFNDKIVWRKIENIYRKRYFQKLKNIIDIEDESRFFIAESVVDDLLKRDKNGEELNIFVGSDVYITDGVHLSKGVIVGDGSKLMGSIFVEENVRIGPGVVISNLKKQKIVIKKNAVLEGRNTIKGNVTVGEKAFVSERVNITGNDLHPTVVGKNSLLRGSCYLFGCRLDDDTIVESSILVKKRVRKKMDGDGNVIPVRFVLPHPHGEEVLEDE